LKGYESIERDKRTGTLTAPRLIPGELQRKSARPAGRSAASRSTRV
jgi:hypothetical protein